MKTFGDMGFRIYGKETRHGMNILQSIQLLFNVGVIIIGNGQALSQMSKYKLCFSICCLIWPLVGFVMDKFELLPSSDASLTLPSVRIFSLLTLSSRIKILSTSNKSQSNIHKDQCYYHDNHDGSGRPQSS